MSNYYSLPVYRAAIELFKQIDLHTKKMPREDRYAFINPIKQHLLEIMKNIANAKETENMAHFIKCALNLINDIKIDIRGLFELKRITQAGFAIISDRAVKLSKQLNGWYNANKIN